MSQNKYSQKRGEDLNEMMNDSPITITLLSSASSTSKKLSNSDKDVDGVHVDAHAGIHWVKRWSSVSNWMSLCLVDNLLCVIQQECPKQDETSIHGHTVKTGSHGCSWGQEC